MPRRRSAIAIAALGLALAACASRPAVEPCALARVTISETAGRSVEISECPGRGQALSPAFRSTAAPAPAADLETLLRRGDLDRLAAVSRGLIAQDDDNGFWRIVAMADAIAAGEPAAARRLLEATKPETRNAPELRYVEAFVAAAEGDADAGVRLLEGAAAEQAEQRDRALALLEELAGRGEDALVIYARLAALAPGPAPRDAQAADDLEDFAAGLVQARTAEAFIRQGLAQRRLGQDDAARASFARALLHEPFSERAAEALAAIDRGDAPPPLTAAAGLARVFADLADSLSSINTLRGGAGGDPEQLRRAALAPHAFHLMAAALDPGAADLQAQAIGGLFAFDEPEAALRALDRTRDLGPYTAWAQVARAQALLDLDREAEARQAARAAAEPAARSFRWSFALAGMQLRLGDDAAAMAALAAAEPLAKGDDDTVEFLALRAGVHDFFGRPADAAADLRRAAAMSGRRDIRSRLAGQLGEYPETRAEAITLWRALLSEREDASTLNGLAWSLILEGGRNLTEGHLLAARAAEAAPRSPEITDTLGWSYYQHGDFVSARRELARAAELMQDDPIAEILEHLGDVHWRLDRQEEARDYWRQALEAHPKLSQRKALEAKLAAGLTTPAPAPRPVPTPSLRNLGSGSEA